MHKVITATFLIVGTLATGDFLRVLDEKKPPKFYGDDIKIAHKAQLGCGACIRGGYIYCIPGAEGSDPSTWAAGTTSVCCKDAATCTQTKDAKYLCSSTYSDTTLAKAMCPFQKSRCGNSPAFSFDQVGQQQNINITLPQGETCSFQIEASCGLPAFKPNDTAGFEIETVDYDDDDLTAPLTLRLLDEKREFGSEKKGPRPNRTMKIQDEDHKNLTSNPAKGPEKKRFNPEEGSQRAFKGGKKGDPKENICKKRYQQISVTALGDVNATTAARILQTAPVYTMALQVGTTDFQASSGMLLKFGTFAFALVGLLLTSF